VSRNLRLALLAAFAGFFALAIATDFPLCPMASTLGVPCPGCGLTRATLALLRGEFSAAFRFHPLVWLLTPLFVGFMASAAFDLARGTSAPRRQLVRWNDRTLSAVATAILIVTLGVWRRASPGSLAAPCRSLACASGSRASGGRAPRHTLNRKCITSPSRTT
jgi:hypothetical protein